MILVALLLVLNESAEKIVSIKSAKRIRTQMKSVRKMREVMMQSAPRPMAALEFLVYSISVLLVLVDT